MLTQEEESTVLESRVCLKVWDTLHTTLKRVRQLGATVDHDGLVAIAHGTVEKSRGAMSVQVEKSWSTSFKRRKALTNLAVTSTQAPSIPEQVQEDNRWRRTYLQESSMQQCHIANLHLPATGHQ